MPRAQRDRWRMKWRSPSGTIVKASATRLVLHDAARVHQRPGEHDVLADRVGPAADGAEVVGPVGRERALRDERAVVGGLHALDAVDPEPVVPALHPGEEVGVGVLGDERAGAGADVLVLGAAGRRARPGR